MCRGQAMEGLEESRTSPECTGGWRSNVGGGTSDRAEEARQGWHHFCRLAACMAAAP